MCYYCTWHFLLGFSLLGGESNNFAPNYKLPGCGDHDTFLVSTETFNCPRPFVHGPSPGQTKALDRSNHLSPQRGKCSATMQPGNT